MEGLRKKHLHLGCDDHVAEIGEDAVHDEHIGHLGEFLATGADFGGDGDGSGGATDDGKGKPRQHDLKVEKFLLVFCFVQNSD